MSDECLAWPGINTAAPACATFGRAEGSLVSTTVREAPGAQRPASVRDNLLRSLHHIQGTGAIHVRRASRCPTCNPGGNPPAGPVTAAYRHKTRRRNRR